MMELLPAPQPASRLFGVQGSLEKPNSLLDEEWGSDPAPKGNTGSPFPNLAVSFSLSPLPQPRGFRLVQVRHGAGH